MTDPLQYSWGPTGPLVATAGTTERVLVTDAHADVVASTTVGDAQVAGTRTYTAWGETRTDTAGFSRPIELGFQSDPTSGATGLVDVGIRHLLPEVGRFSTRDVLFGDPATPVSLNRYAYGGANPVTMADPTGMLRSLAAAAQTAAGKLPFAVMDEYRRARREAILALPGRKRALEETLRAALDPDERLEAISVRPLVGLAITGRRLMTAHGGWRDRPARLESYTLDEIEGWQLGWTHDGRPFVVLRHPPRLRPEHAPAHRVLWFEWGNRTVSVPRGTTTIRFSTRRDRVFCALTDTLEALDVERGATIHQRPEGSRQPRVAPLVAYSAGRRRALLRSSRLRRRGPIPPG
jgi:RHS repeat-associated protein